SITGVLTNIFILFLYLTTVFVLHLVLFHFLFILWLLFRNCLLIYVCLYTLIFSRRILDWIFIVIPFPISCFTSIDSFIPCFTLAALNSTRCIIFLLPHSFIYTFRHIPFFRYQLFPILFEK